MGKHKRIIYIGISALVLGIVLSGFGTYSGVSLERVTLTSLKDAKQISALYLEPSDKPQGKVPAVVFCHSLLTAKELYYHLYSRFVLAGWAVIAIDLSGHGRSDGPNDFGKSEMFDVWAAVEYLASKPGIDDTRIAVMGHSLGGITTTRSAALDATGKISASVAIFTWQGFQDAVESVFGPMGNFIGRAWPAFAWGKTFDANNEAELRERDVITLLNPMKPRNYMLIVGTADELISTNKAEEIIARAAGLDKIKDGEIYGSFKDGTARKLVLTKDDHLSEAVSNKVFAEAYTWLLMAWNLKGEIPGRARALARLLGMGLAIIGVLLLMGPVRKWAWDKVSANEDDAEENMEDNPGTGGNRRLVIIILAIVFWAASWPAFSLALNLGIKPVAPNWGADMFSVFALGRLILIVPLCAVAFLLLRKRVDFSRETLFRGNYVKFQAAALAPFVWLLLALLVLSRILILPPMYPQSPMLALLFFVILVPHFLVDEFLLRGAYQSGLKAMSYRKQMRYGGLIYGLLGGVGLAGAFLTFIPRLGYKISIPQGSIHFVPAVIIACVGIFLAHGYLAAYFYTRTKNILAGAVTSAVLVAWILCSVGVRGF